MLLFQKKKISENILVLSNQTQLPLPLMDLQFNQYYYDDISFTRVYMLNVYCDHHFVKQQFNIIHLDYISTIHILSVIVSR